MLILFIYLYLTVCLQPKTALVTVFGQAQYQQSQGNTVYVQTQIKVNKYSVNEALLTSNQIIRLAKLLLKTYKVNPQAIQISKEQIIPVYSMVRRQNIYIGTTIYTTFNFECEQQNLKNGKIIDQLVKIGISKISKIQWAQSQVILTYQKQKQQNQHKMYINAYLNAKQKAQTMCMTMNAKVKNPIQIQQIQQQEDQNNKVDQQQEQYKVKLKVTFECKYNEKKGKKDQ